MGEDQYTIRVTRIVTVAGRIEALPPNPLRVALQVSCNTAGPQTFAVATGWGNAEPVFSLGDGLYLLFKYSDSGPFCAGAWSLESTLAATVTYWTETLLLSR